MEPGFPENSFSLVIPTLNEAGNIDRVLRELTDSLRNTQHEYEVIVVDDGSTDGTVEQVRSWAARDPRIRLLSRAGEKGLAGAVLYGWGHSRANFLGVMDADLQHPPQLLPRLLEEAGRADIAIASRYAQEHGTKGWNPLRAVVSRLSTLAAAPLISRKKLRVTDPMSGFFVIRRRCIKGLVFQATGFKLLLEILVRGRIQNVREVPYQFGLRQVGQSKANATVALHYLHLLGRLSRDLVLHPSGQ
jgi:dolichol-phosphate mannosyltransferase